jgi:hypothetical protein
MAGRVMDPNLLEIGGSPSLEGALTALAKALNCRRRTTSLELFETGVCACSR